MTIVVEDGLQLSGSPTPNSYVTEAEFIEFYVDRNDPLFTDSPQPATAVLEGAIIYGWDYLIQEFRMRWRGSRVDPVQAGDWPRRGVPIPDFFDPFYQDTGVPHAFRDTVFWGEDEIPQEVKDAQMLLARQSLSDATTVESLLTSVGRVTKREKLGPLEVEYFGVAEGGERQTTMYLDALKRIQPFLRPTNTGIVLRS